MMISVLVDVLQAQRMQLSMACTINGRCFFRATGGYMGVGPARLRVGDCISGFLGGQVLYAIRPCKQDGEYTFLRECYTHGLIDSEGLSYKKGWLIEESTCNTTMTTNIWSTLTYKNWWDSERIDHAEKWCLLPTFFLLTQTIHSLVTMNTSFNTEICLGYQVPTSSHKNLMRSFRCNGNRLPKLQVKTRGGTHNSAIINLVHLAQRQWYDDTSYISLESM